MSGTGRLSPPDLQRADAGATLLEMMVVVAILALIAGLVFPNLRRPYAALAAETSRAAVEADLRRARAEAIHSGREVAFEVAEDGREYSAGRRDVRLPDRVRLLAEPRSITFAPDGASAGGRLVLTRPGGRPLAVTVTSGLGLVQGGEP
jgi:general secretion pathway protein H